MDHGALVLIALAIGLVFGAALALVFVLAARRGNSAAEVTNPVVPDGIDAVLDAMESAGIVLDPSNVVLKTSPSAMTWGLVWNQALTSPELVDLVDRVRRSGEPLVEQMTLTRGRFSEGTIHLSVKVTTLGSRYMLVLAEDRTEAFLIEEVRRDFVANVSHELKTPIGAISLLAEALESGADDHVMVRRFAKRLLKESERLARITREIIDLSRLQFQDKLEHVTLVDVDSVVAIAIDNTQVVAEAQGIDLVSGGTKGTRVYGDEGQLAVAIKNLVENAVRYSPKNSRVGVGVSVHSGAIEVAVTDQGVGIAEEDLPRVFERFYRVDQSRARNTGGTGLGLSITKHIVQNHGGEVRAWSQPGRGSTFTIRLPEIPEDQASGESP